MLVSVLDADAERIAAGRPPEPIHFEETMSIPADEVPAAVERQLKKQDPYYRPKFAAAVGVIAAAIAYKYAPLIKAVNYV